MEKIRKNKMEKINTKDILKVVRIGKSNSLRDSLMFTKFPLPKDNTSFFKIVIDRWYHNFFYKRRNQFYRWLHKRKDLCTCECHYNNGFYHCWGLDCCDQINQELIKGEKNGRNKKS
jgi:hypothetical protein